jgi:uncharacterized membrane protein YcaP (DUF421 family)
MLAPWPVLLDVAIRTSVIYLALLVGLRLTGKRQLGQMSTFDFVLLLIIANAVQNAMVGSDTSLAGGLVAAAVLLTWHQVIDRLRRSSRRVGRLLGGTADLLIYQGRVLGQHLERENLTIDELRQALREHGVGTLQDVHMAVLEPDGAISVIRNDDVDLGTKPHHRIRSLRRSS